ncbi:cytochrome c family protein [uncultured Jannaschia sp.]|uniref:c-type cytochrome n=1 Tax=uncultured Jannaschia sp. TaxID=293347 RepID=UPI002631983C|nr:cytochrome c family protein [uncultured Jannaschia sp.]
MTVKTFAAAGFLALAAGAAFAQDAEITGDAEAGERVFRRCMACHAVGPDARTKVGPILNGVIGRTAGVREDFEYSDAMVEAGENGMAWTPEELDAYLLNPKSHVPGTKMAFPGLRKDEDRADVIAYLATFPENGVSSEEGS